MFLKVNDLLNEILVVPHSGKSTDSRIHITKWGNSILKTMYPWRKSFQSIVKTTIKLSLASMDPSLVSAS